jgi:hypothetical protein
MPAHARRRWPSILAIVLLFPGLAGADDVRIRGSVANVRAEASSQGKVLFQVKAGDVLRLLAVSGDWLHVETPDGRRGYVSKTLGDVIASAPAAAPAALPPGPPGGVRSGSVGGTLAIEHQDVGCIVGDRYPRLDACFTPSGDLGNAKVLFRAGEGPWYAVDLLPEGACHVAYLPKPLQTTTEIQYYVAAVDKAFNARQQPEAAPESAYRARVVKNPGDCDRLKRVATSVRNVAKPIVVAAGRTGMGAPAALGALLVGFSQQGVVLATAAAAAGAGGAAVAGASAGAAGSGGGIGTTTLAIAGGAVAVGALAAVAAGGGGDEPAACNIRDIAGQIPAGIVVVDAQTICGTETVPCRGGLTLKSCVGGICTNSCTAFYELSDGRRFSCGALSNCLSPGGAIESPNTFCLAAAQQVVQACQ